MNNPYDYKKDASVVENNLRNDLSFPRSRIDTKFMKGLFHKTAKDTIIGSIGPSEWIVTSKCIVESWDSSGVECNFCESSAVTRFKDNLGDVRKKQFQSDYHGNGHFLLHLRYTTWIYPNSITWITDNTQYRQSSSRSVEINFHQR